MQLKLRDMPELISAGKAIDRLAENVLKYFKPTGIGLIRTHNVSIPKKQTV
jgi:hypothetical protein